MVEFFSLKRGTGYPHSLIHFLHTWYVTSTVIDTEDSKVVKIVPLLSKTFMVY